MWRWIDDVICWWILLKRKYCFKWLVSIEIEIVQWMMTLMQPTTWPRHTLIILFEFAEGNTFDSHCYNKILTPPHILFPTHLVLWIEQSALLFLLLRSHKNPLLEEFHFATNYYTLTLPPPRVSLKIYYQPRPHRITAPAETTIPPQENQKYISTVQTSTNLSTCTYLKIEEYSFF